MGIDSVESVLVLIAIGIGVCTACVGLGTLGTAGWSHRKRKRHTAIRERMKSDLLQRVFEPDPEWDEFVSGLSSAERRQLEVVLETHLRQLRGTEHERLCGLADHLNIQARAKRNITAGKRIYRSLTWLALLREPIAVDVLRRHCTETARHRAAAARVLYENETARAAQTGTELLIGDGDQPLSAFGLDTLYQLNDGTETPLLASFPAAIEAWETPVLVQALLALRYVQLTQTEWEWLPELFAHDSPRVRAATLGVAERHGWRPATRSRIDVDALVTDPDPSVRADAYLLLASWGDAASAQQLHACVGRAFDSQLLAVIRAIWLHPQTDLPEPTERTRPVIDWVTADGEITGTRNRVWGGNAAWG